MHKTNGSDFPQQSIRSCRGKAYCSWQSRKFDHVLAKSKLLKIRGKGHQMSGYSVRLSNVHKLFRELILCPLTLKS